ncbi:MAG: hypothetical protein JKY51_08025, partial [Opitutaceae bacterium]|nr:hypothetical protein [Opitutaceae bacterium]
MAQSNSSVGISGGTFPDGAFESGVSPDDGQGGTTIELRDIIAFIRRRFLTLSVTTIVALVLSVIALSQITPRYEATSTVLLEARQS